MSTNNPLEDALKNFLGTEAKPEAEAEVKAEKAKETKVIHDKSILERKNKIIITEDGRQLLI